MSKVFLVILLSVSDIIISAQDTVRWRGPERNGIYYETGLMKKWQAGGPDLLWHYDELGDGHTSAAVTGNGIYITGMINGTGYVYAFDLTGKLLWKKEYGPEWTENYNGSRSTPYIINDKLFLLSTFGKLVCIKCSNGQIEWTIDLVKDYGAVKLIWGMTENLLSDGNVLYCTPGGRDASVLALNINTGKLIWKNSSITEKSAYCSPIIVKLQGKKILITMMEKSICGFETASGKLLWKFEHINEYNVHPNIPIYYDGYLFCASEFIGGVMLRLTSDGSSVTKVWENRFLDPVTGGAVVLNGRIYGAGSSNRKFYCLDWKTGKEIFSVRDMAPSSVIASDGLLYVYSESGKISLVQPLTNALNTISSFNVPFGTNLHMSHPVIKNKRLYVRHGTSLMVYNIAE
jgi:outer membrane protein assembly factor BamB